MTVRELLRRLLDHALDGRGAHETVLIQCDGELREISEVRTGVTETGQDTPDLFILVVADGPSDLPVASAITPRSPRV